MPDAAGRPARPVAASWRHTPWRTPPIAAGLAMEALAGDHQATPLGPLAERAVLIGRFCIVARCPAPSANVRLLLVEDVAQVSQYIRNLLNAQDQVKLLDVLTDGRHGVRSGRADAAGRAHDRRPAPGQGRRPPGARAAPRRGLSTCRSSSSRCPSGPSRSDPAMGIVRVLSMPFSGFDFIERGPGGAARARGAAARSRPPRRFVVLRCQGRRGQDDAGLQPRRRHRARPGPAGQRSWTATSSSVTCGHSCACRMPHRPCSSCRRTGSPRRTSSRSSGATRRASTSCSRRPASRWPRWSPCATWRRPCRCCSRIYHVVIIDTPTLVSDQVLAWFDACDVIIEHDHRATGRRCTTRASWPTPSRPSGIRHERVCYVLNRAGAPGSIDPRLIVEQLGRRPDFSLPSDGRLVVEANNRASRSCSWTLVRR